MNDLQRIKDYCTSRSKCILANATTDEKVCSLFECCPGSDPSTWDIEAIQKALDTIDGVTSPQPIVINPSYIMAMLDKDSSTEIHMFPDKVFHVNESVKEIVDMIDDPMNLHVQRVRLN